MQSRHCNTGLNSAAPGSQGNLSPLARDELDALSKASRAAIGLSNGGRGRNIKKKKKKKKGPREKSDEPLEESIRRARRRAGDLPLARRALGTVPGACRTVPSLESDMLRQRQRDTDLTDRPIERIAKRLRRG